jgi:hypothetical protein
MRGIVTAREMLRLGGVKAPCPATIAPQLATKATRPPAGSAWIYHLKLKWVPRLVLPFRGVPGKAA